MLRMMQRAESLTFAGGKTCRPTRAICFWNLAARRRAEWVLNEVIVSVLFLLLSSSRLGAPSTKQTIIVMPICTSFERMRVRPLSLPLSAGLCTISVGVRNLLARHAAGVPALARPSPPLFHVALLRRVSLDASVNPQTLQPSHHPQFRAEILCGSQSTKLLWHMCLRVHSQVRCPHRQCAPPHHRQLPLMARPPLQLSIQHGRRNH